MNEDQTPEEIVAEVKEVVTRVWTGDQAEVSFNGARLNDVREIVVSPKQHAKLADRHEDVAKLKEELRLKMAARYGNRHDRRQAAAMGRKAATKARHLAWKKAARAAGKQTPLDEALEAFDKLRAEVAARFPAGAHQPGILNSAKRAVRELARDIEQAE